MLSTPVVLVAFNRADLTRRTLDAVRAARPERLLLVVDGPRADHPDDAERCAAVRAVLEDVDWPCEVHRRYAETNLGLEANVELGLDWVFGLVEEAIVLEDDCVPGPSFFGFVEELLERYRDDERVWQVSGSGLGVPQRLFGGADYAFAAWASVWGWATWADRWQRHRSVFVRDHRGGAAGERPVRTVAASPQPGLLVTRSGRAHFAEAAVSDDTVTHGWDKHWWLTMMTFGGLAVTPAVNLVENVGWGADATHGVAHGKRDHPAVALAGPVVHPPAIALDVEVERELEMILGRVGGRGVRLARRLVRSPRVRAVGRRVLNSRAVVGAQRMMSRFGRRSAGA